MNNRVVVSRVAFTTGPSLDLDDVITKKEIQCQNIPHLPPNRTYETRPTGITRAGDTGVSETGQMIGEDGMDGNTVAIQQRMGKQRVKRAQTREQGPPSAPAVFLRDKL